MQKSIVKLLASSSILLMVSSCEESTATSVFFDVPDLTQTEIGGPQHGNGQMYCAPVAVSNSLSWLFKIHDQHALAKTLASKNYMNTSLKNGTSTVGVQRGVERFLRSKNQNNFQMSYQGWRKHLSKYGTQEKQPSLSHMKNHIGENKSAWINIGWYKAVGTNWKRVGGHWVTLVGRSDTKQNTFFIHDPAPRSGTQKKTHTIELKEILSGRLTGKKTGLPRSANGYYQITTGLKMSSKADIAAIDRVVGLSLAN